jgi:hypothetical protein
MAEATDTGTVAHSEKPVGVRPWLVRSLVVSATLFLGISVWTLISASHPSDITSAVVNAVLGLTVLLLYREEKKRLAQKEAKALVGEVAVQGFVSRLPTTHPSVHHLFDDRDLLRPRGGGNVDMILDAADLPQALMAYVKDIHAAGAKARVLLLDPSSALTERHRFVQQSGGDASTAVQHFRAKISAAIEELGPLATVRLFDALPPGNLIIVDDHIFWGGIPSVPSDASYPIFGVTANTRENVYWAFRRNFDALWKQAKPVDTNAPRTTRSIAAASL